MTVIDEVKARIDIIDLVSETVKLRRSGKNYTGFCPFHSNTRTPAFVVFPDSGTWRCFGQCNEGGDIFGYVMKKEGWDFNEALRYLAERAGVQLKPFTPQDQEAAEEGDRLRQLLEEVVIFYRHQLINTPPGKVALEYLHKRGLQDETLEAFGLGYAPNSWDETHRYFLSKGYTEKELQDAGMVSERDTGGIYDKFRHRITFPIRDERGRMAGFGARILDPNDIPKFLNSPQTPLFDKGKLLYGLDRARKPIRTQDQAVIVEGYLDVIALHQAGFANAVSPMGTALTEHQLALLKRFTRKIVLALDPDAAGDKATLRGLQIARQTMDRESDPVFDARGLLSHEARLQADIRVTTLPPGKDPDDVVLNNPEDWQQILANAKPIVVHVMETLAAGRDLEDPKVKSQVASQVLPLIRDLPNPIERDTYRQRLARLLRVDERSLPDESRILPPRPRRQRSSRTPASDQGSSAETSAGAQRPQRSIQNAAFTREAHVLGVLLRRPDLLYKVDRNLIQEELARLDPMDFQHTDHQTIFRLIQESVDQDESEPLSYVMNRLSLPLMDLADSLLERTEKLDPNEERVLDDLMRAILDLRIRNTRQRLEHLQFLMLDAQEEGDPLASQYLNNGQEFRLVLNRLDHALGQYTSRSVSSR
jgi:DNA primase